MVKPGVSNLFVHRAKWTIFKEVVGRISNITVNETLNTVKCSAQLPSTPLAQSAGGWRRRDATLHLITLDTCCSDFMRCVLVRLTNWHAVRSTYWRRSDCSADLSPSGSTTCRIFHSLRDWSLPQPRSPLTSCECSSRFPPTQ